MAWEACGCDGVTRIGYRRRGSVSGLDKIRYLASPNGQMASNVTLARNGAGALFAAWASWTPGPTPAQPHLQASDIHIQFSRWPAGANGFEAPVELSDPITDALYDKPWMIVTADDVLVISYSDLRRGGILAVSSADGGASFQRAVIDKAQANLAALCPDGRPGGAFATYVATRSIRVAHTADGGVTWSVPVAVALSDATGNIAFHDPTCIANGDEVWISYGRTLDSYDTPVAQALTDAGDAAGDGGVSPEFLLFPQLARHADGKLALATYRAASEGPGSADLVYVTSADAGRSFAIATTFAAGLTPTLQRHVPAWLGDYFGWGPTETGLGAAFVDNASGFSHIVFDEAVLPSGVSSKP